MRVGKSASRVFDLRLDAAAKHAAQAVRLAGSGRAAERFLVRLAAHLQDEPQPRPEPRPDPGRAAGAPITKARR